VRYFDCLSVGFERERTSELCYQGAIELKTVLQLSLFVDRLPVTVITIVTTLRDFMYKDEPFELDLYGFDNTFALNYTFWRDLGDLADADFTDPIGITDYIIATKVRFDHV
jgi:hypothetical protein